ncbi:MAG: bifunctional lysylphosphatidylglycerol flippase/synthetase MprF [Ilumatobacteraceae bacterium]
MSNVSDAGALATGTGSVTDRPASPSADDTAAPAVDDDAAAPQPDEGPRRNVGLGVRLLGRYWATTVLILAIIVAGLVTGALWNGVPSDGQLFDDVAYGLPALQDGKWWTLLLGQFFSPQLIVYIPILILLVVAASTYERRVGHWRTLLVVIGGQALSALITAGFLDGFDGTGWTWATRLAGERDLGISAGGFAVVAALTAAIQPVWRRRVRVGFSAYLLVMVLDSGLLWDVEHFVAWVVGLLAGPLLVFRRLHAPRLDFSRRTQRAIVALIIAVASIAGLIESVFPGNGGPFHTQATDQAEQSTGATLFGAIFALVLLLLADGLRRGRRVAWIFMTALFLISFVSLFSLDPSAERTANFVIVGGQLVLLLVTFRAFSARAPARSLRRVARRLITVAAGLFAYTAIGFFVLQDDFVPEATIADMIGEFASRLIFIPSGNIEPQTRAATWFVTSIGAVWIITILVTIVGLTYASRRVQPVAEEDVRLRGLLRRYQSSSIEWMLTWKGNTIWFTADEQTAIGYRTIGSVALCLADPVGPLEQRVDALRQFDAFCFERGWIPCLFAAGVETAELAPQLGWKAVQVAEDSIIPLANLEFKGKQWQDIRTAINKAGKQDVRFEVTSWADAKPVVADQLRAISGGWVADKSLPEMGFTLGSLAEADDPDVRLHLAIDADQTIEGFTSWMPISENGEIVGWTIDLMRRRDHGFRPVMEFMIGASALRFKEEGYRYISLSAAPLAKAPDALGGNSDQEVLQRLLDFLGDILEPYYGFQSLFSFKRKFQPELRPMYLVFPDSTALAEIGIAVARAYMPDATAKDWALMSVDMSRPHHATAPHDD